MPGASTVKYIIVRVVIGSHNIHPNNNTITKNRMKLIAAFFKQERLIFIVIFIIVVQGLRFHLLFDKEEISLTMSSFHLLNAYHRTTKPPAADYSG